MANFDESGLGRTSAVGSYPKGASWAGTLDMAGNVWEWCQDTYETYEDGNLTNPAVSGAPGSGRVLRGGSWLGVAARLRASNRGWVRPAGRDGVVGFRVVLPPGTSDTCPPSPQLFDWAATAGGRGSRTT